MFHIILWYLILFLACLQIYLYAIDVVVGIIVDNNQNINITQPQLKKLVVFAISQTNFLFSNEIYDETNGVAIKSPLGLALANHFIGYHEKHGLILKRVPKFHFISDMYM